MIGRCAGEGLPRVVVWNSWHLGKRSLGLSLGVHWLVSRKRFVVRGDWLVSRSLDLVQSHCAKQQGSWEGTVSETTRHWHRRTIIRLMVTTKLSWASGPGIMIRPGGGDAGNQSS